MNRVHQLMVRLTAELSEQVEREAQTTERTQAQVLRRALRLYFADPTRERRR